MTYTAKDFSSLKGMKGFSDELLDDHFSLYEGYVKNTNKLLSKLSELAEEAKDDSVEHDELRRRLGWEWNGMRLHEFYFENLGGDGELDDGFAIAKNIERDFGSLEKWQHELTRVGGMRGVGWVILYYDPAADRLMNFWIDEHDSAHAAGGTPLVVMDVWEHAFWTDYRTDKDAYMKAFLSNVDWSVAEKRLEAGRRMEALAVSA